MIMRKPVENNTRNQNSTFKLWMYSIVLSPICFCAVWGIFYSIPALYRTIDNLKFGHGAEILIVLPFAIIVVVIQLKLLKSLIRIYREKNL